MKTFSIKEALGYGWETFKKHTKLLMLGGLIVLLLGNLQNSDMVMKNVPSLLETVLVILFFGLSTLISIGWYKLLFKIMDGKPADLKEIFAHSSLFFRYLGVMAIALLVSGIPAGLGALAVFGAIALGQVWIGVVLGVISLCVSIYATLRYSLVFPIVVDQETSIGRTFKESARLTEGVKWKLVLLAVVVVLVNILGVIALVVGLLVSVPVTTLSYLHIYRQLSGPKNA